MYDIVLIGSSVGGPKALYEIIDKFDDEFNLPIVIIQHLPPTFEFSLIEVLQEKAKKEIILLENGVKIENNKIYLSKGGYQCKIDNNKYVNIVEDINYNFSPSIDKTAEEILKTFNKPILVILSGFSKGEDGLKASKEFRKKNFPVILQDKATSLIYGIQKIIKQNNFYTHEAPIYKIPGILLNLIRSQK